MDIGHIHFDVNIVNSVHNIDLQAFKQNNISLTMLIFL